MTRRLKLTSLENRLTPAVATWDGGGGNNLWSTPANWVGDIAPNPGDGLIFPASALRHTNVNDFAAGRAFGAIVINDSSYLITGNAISLGSGGLTSQAFSGSLIALDITLTAQQTWTIAPQRGLTVSGSINLNGQLLDADVSFGDNGAGLLTTGVISGAGTLVKMNGGFWNLTGNNTYTGLTRVAGGILIAGSSGALGAIGLGNETQVEAAGTLALQPPLDNSEAITFQGDANFPATLLVVGHSTLRGPLTLAGPTVFSGGDLTITAGIGETGPPRSLTFNNAAVTFAAGSNNTYSGVTAISNSSGIEFNGTGPFGPIAAAGGNSGVNGTGTIGPVTIQSAAFIRPGSSNIGSLTTGNLVIAPGAGGVIGGDLFNTLFANGVSNSINVAGTVQLGGLLSTALQLGFAPTVGTRWTVIHNDGSDPVQGIFEGEPEGGIVLQQFGVDIRITYVGGDGNDIELFATAQQPAFSVGAGAGGTPQVNVYDSSGNTLKVFNAYDPAFRGGVHVATGDITGDGVNDIVTGPGVGGGPDIRVFDGTTGALVKEFLAYDPAFVGGVFVAIGDVNGDGQQDIVTGAGPGGGPHVKAFDGATLGVISSFFAYDPNFRGGVSVAAGNLAGEPADRIVTGAGPGGGPHVRTFDAAGVVSAEFMAYEISFRGGVNVAVTQNILGGGGIVTAPGAGRAPEVRIWIANGLSDVQRFLAYDAAFQGGVTVAVAPVGPNGVDAIVTGAGPGGGPHVKAFEGSFTAPPATLLSFFAFDPSFTGGVFVG